MAKEAAKILDNKKGLDIRIIKIKDISVLADYIVIATGTSGTHVKALAGELEEQFKKIGITPKHVEGHRSDSWILIDCNTVIVHVFSNEAREFYNLEKLWESGEIVEY